MLHVAIHKVDHRNNDELLNFAIETKNYENFKFGITKAKDLSISYLMLKKLKKRKRSDCLTNYLRYQNSHHYIVQMFNRNFEINLDMDFVPKLLRNFLKTVRRIYELNSILIKQVFEQSTFRAIQGNILQIKYDFGTLEFQEYLNFINNRTDLNIFDIKDLRMSKNSKLSSEVIRMYNSSVYHEIRLNAIRSLKEGYVHLNYSYRLSHQSQYPFYLDNYTSNFEKVSLEGILFSSKAVENNVQLFFTMWKKFFYFPFVDFLDNISIYTTNMYQNWLGKIQFHLDLHDNFGNELNVVPTLELNNIIIHLEQIIEEEEFETNEMLKQIYIICKELNYYFDVSVKFIRFSLKDILPFSLRTLKDDDINDCEQSNGEHFHWDNSDIEFSYLNLLEILLVTSHSQSFRYSDDMTDYLRRTKRLINRMNYFMNSNDQILIRFNELIYLLNDNGVNNCQFDIEIQPNFNEKLVHSRGKRFVRKKKKKSDNETEEKSKSIKERGKNFVEQSKKKVKNKFQRKKVKSEIPINETEKTSKKELGNKEKKEIKLAKKEKKSFMKRGKEIVIKSKRKLKRRLKHKNNQNIDDDVDNINGTLPYTNFQFRDERILHGIFPHIKEMIEDMTLTEFIPVPISLVNPLSAIGDEYYVLLFHTSSSTLIVHYSTNANAIEKFDKFYEIYNSTLNGLDPQTFFTIIPYLTKNITSGDPPNSLHIRIWKFDKIVHTLYHYSLNNPRKEKIPIYLLSMIRATHVSGIILCDIPIKLIAIDESSQRVMPLSFHAARATNGEWLSTDNLPTECVMPLDYCEIGVVIFSYMFPEKMLKTGLTNISTKDLFNTNAFSILNILQNIRTYDVDDVLRHLRRYDQMNTKLYDQSPRVNDEYQTDGTFSSFSFFAKSIFMESHFANDLKIDSFDDIPMHTVRKIRHSALRPINILQEKKSIFQVTTKDISNDASLIHLTFQLMETCGNTFDVGAVGSEEDFLLHLPPDYRILFNVSELRTNLEPRFE
ncbi:hypothetical protein SNEBB_005417 [Seison nebaliae]|nr:hypothetical protein SNEBB_005417 [Seison nebaliae]